MKLSLAIVSLVVLASFCKPAFADDWDSPAAGTAPAGHDYYAQPYTVPALQSEQPKSAPAIAWDLGSLKPSVPVIDPYGSPNLAPCSTAILSIISGPREANGLPPCSLDSFVQNAGGNKDQIYGDEGAKLFDFKSIDSGIIGETAAGLTTGQAQ